MGRDTNAIGLCRNFPSRICVALVVAASSLFAGNAHAAYPDRAITLIVSFPPAGATDVLARAIGQKMSEALNQTVVVENRPGAGGNIGLAAAARAAPDGYTVYMAAVTNAAIAASAYAPQPAHLVRSFVPIAGVGTVPHILVVPASLPVQNVGQLVSYLKAAPGKYNFASQGAGTLSHLEAELFKMATGADVVHIPYKGSAQAMPDLIAGSAQMMFDSITGSMPHVRSGKLRVLAVASGKRVSSLPNVPTVQESGVKGYEANNLFGLLAPHGTPQSVINTLSKAIENALASPELQQRLEAQGFELKFTPTDEFGRMVGQEFHSWGKVVENAGVRPD